MGHLQRNVFPSIVPILLSLVSLFGYSVFKVLIIIMSLQKSSKLLCEIKDERIKIARSIF